MARDTKRKFNSAGQQSYLHQYQQNEQAVDDLTVQLGKPWYKYMLYY